MRADIVVLSEKLRRPASRGLSRERLIQPIVRADGPPTALVVALAGAGKTTLLAQVAARFEGAVAWYRPTADDRSTRAMVAHLVRALVAADYLSSDRQTDDIDELLATLDRHRKPCAILLDDLHEIRGTPAEVALERFVELRPLHVRLVMGSRSAPLFNLPRLRVSGEIVEIGNEDLRFRSWEVEQLLLEVYGEPLPPEPVAALTRKIGGWAAGIQLFHLATSDKSPLERCQVVADLDGRSHLIRSYLARNVLAGLSDEKRRFLTRTCTLGRLTAPLCDALLGTTRSAEVLADLEESQLFTSSDDDGLSYRYHQVLQVYLEAALVEELGPRLARAAYARGAALLEAEGASYDALRAYARAEDWTSVARVLGKAPRHLSRGSGSWEDLIPADLRQRDPWFAMADARRQLRRGLVDAAVTTYRHAAGLLDDPSFQDQCLGERRLASAWTATPSSLPGRADQSPGWHWTLRVRAATRRTPQSLPRSEPAQATPGDWTADGLCSLLAGDLVSAAEELHSAVQVSETGSLERSAALLGSAVVDILRAERNDPVRGLETARLAAELGGHEWVGQLASSLHLALRRRDGWTEHDVGTLVRTQPTPSLADDLWGAALDALVVGMSRECAGESGTAQLVLAAERFEALDATVLQAWALSGAALGEAWRGGPASGELVAAAEGVARRSGAAGPQALLAGATALVAGAEKRTELTMHAHALAAQCGFDPAVLLSPKGVSAVSTTPVGDSSTSERTDPAAVVLTCFGGFRLHVGPAEVDLTTLRPRARTLLRLLALSLGHDVHREYIGECLWPGLPLASAMRSLQVSMSSLRQVLDAAGLSGPDVLSRRGDAYRFSLPLGSRADVNDLQSGLRRAATASDQGTVAEAVRLRRQALELYTGDLLPEDGPAEWVVGERERLRVLAATGALEQARDRQRLGDTSEAIRSALMSVQTYRFGDQAWDLLAELHESAGNTAEALWTRKEHASVVAELFAPDAAEPPRHQEARSEVNGRRPGAPPRGAARALV